MADYLSVLDSIGGLILLALVAFCDTLIGIGFFVFGEVAFLAAGAAFSANGSIFPVILVLLAAWLGDLASFALGRCMGARASLCFLTTKKRRSAWRCAKLALEKHGALFVVVSRLLGPVAWVTPFMAGTLNMPAHRFAASSCVGVTLGVGQFLIIGAVGQQALVLLEPNTTWLVPMLTTGLIGGAAILTVWHKGKRAF